MDVATCTAPVLTCKCLRISHASGKSNLLRPLKQTEVHFIFLLNLTSTTSISYPLHSWYLAVTRHTPGRDMLHTLHCATRGNVT